MERGNPRLVGTFDRYELVVRRICRERRERATGASAPTATVVTMSDLEPAYCQAHVQVGEAQTVFEQIATQVAATLRADEATQLALEQAFYECVAARRRVEQVLCGLPGAAFLALGPQLQPVRQGAPSGGLRLEPAAG